MAPATAVGRRRLAILKRLVAADAPLTTVKICLMTGFSPRTVLTHLHFLSTSGFVLRPDYRSWTVPPTLTLRAFDGTRLDSQEEPNVAHR